MLECSITFGYLSTLRVNQETVAHVVLPKMPWGRGVCSTQCSPRGNLSQAGVKSRREQWVGVWGVRGWRDFCAAVSITPVNTHLPRPPTSIKCSMSQVKALLILQAITPLPRLRVTEGDRKFLKLQASFPPIPDCSIRGSDPPPR